MSTQRQVRIAAVADLHFDGRARGQLRALFADAARQAEILALCGDLTTHGEREQIEAFVEELEGVDIPIVAVLGNHDYEAGEQGRLAEVLESRGVHVLDGSNVVIDGIGFAGVKGFGGGFGRWTLGPFGEPIYKEFVQMAIGEALKLETALRTLEAETRVVLMHYSPVRETLAGEPEEIYPFLGSSRLLPPIETYDVSAVFHGHAHSGLTQATTPSGVPVFNVAREVLQRTEGEGFRLWSAAAPERRGRKGPAPAPSPSS